MKCESLQFDLPLYLDDVLSEERCLAISGHLRACPLCRVKLDEFREIKNDLRVNIDASIPSVLMKSIRGAVAAELSAPTINIGSPPEKSLREIISYWLMPYSVGTLAALVLTFTLLTSLSTTRNASNEIALNENPDLRTTTLVAVPEFDDQPSDVSVSDDLPVVALDGNTPRVNPTGALLALTRSIVRGEMKDEEVVIVADVFSDGIARINQVVEAPSNDELKRELEKAFRNDPGNAPFLPPTLEKNTKAVRVILKIQRVDVSVPTPKKKLRDKLSS